MHKRKHDLVAKILALPFTEPFFNYLLEKKIRNSSIVSRLYDSDFLTKIYNALKSKYTISSIDEIGLLLNAFYPENDIRASFTPDIQDSSICLSTIFKISKAFITKRDGYVAFKPWETSDEADFLGAYKGIHKVEFWNSLTRILSPDLLITSYLIDKGLEDEYNLKDINAHIVMADIPLKKIFQKGLAEIHMHAQAGIDYCSKWADMTNIENFSILENGKYYYLHNSYWRYRIKVSAVIRFLLALYLEKFCTKGTFQDFFVKCLKSNLAEKQYKYLDYIIGYIISGDIELHYLHFNVQHIVDDNFEPKSNIKHLLEENITLTNIIYKLCNIFEMQMTHDKHIDILDTTVFQKYIYLNTTSENILLLKALKKMKHDKFDKTFSKLFWKYIKIKNEVFASFVQNNAMQGLEYFQEFYRRATDISSYNSVRHFYRIFRCQFLYEHVKKLELRITPSCDGYDDEYQIKKTLSHIIAAYYKYLFFVIKEANLPKANTPRIGIIYHFIKKFDSPYGKCIKGQKNYPSEKLYYLDLRSKYKQSAKIIYNLRQTIPYLSNYIVGIDAASIENDMEPWVLAPIFRVFRNSVTDKLIEPESSKRIKTIGFTYHVGEEFRHLMSAFRHIDEVIEFYKLRSGDRIGHAVALGIDVDTWVNNNNAVTIPKIEYLENLLWLWGVYTKESMINAHGVSQLERKIMDIACKIFRGPNDTEPINMSPYLLFMAYRSKFQDVKLYGDCPLQQETDSGFIWSIEKIKYAYFCERYLQKMCEVEIIECTDDDKIVLKSLQEALLKKVQNEGIIIETNPTSNIAISAVDKMKNHTIFNLNNTYMDNPTRKAIATINSDDPVVFNTTVLNEFAYIYYSLLEQGYSREVVLEWIDKIREYGMMNSFINNDGHEIDIDTTMKELKVIYKRLTGNELDNDLKNHYI